MDPSEFCREVETYLCRKNEGHLVRIVGPAFEQVCGWAVLGVPLKLAFRGIDQYCDRYYAKGPRRRPVRIEFCEADILDLFDGWRRAIGVTSVAEPVPAATAQEGPVPRRAPLAAHIERAIARLTVSRAGQRRGPAFDSALASAVLELDSLSADARQARGEGRAAIIGRLSAIDRDLIAASLSVLDASFAAALRREAESELAPFGSRMAAEARARAVDAAFVRLVRESLGLPVLDYD